MEPAASSTAPAALIYSIASLFAAALAAYVCLLAPGQAWWRGSASSTPRLFARVALSTLTTTLLGLALAALGSFSLPRLALLGGAVTLAGYVFVARVRHEEPALAARAGIGPVIFALALWVYWPPFETHFAGADSSSYTAAGVHLARAHRLWKLDPLVDELSPALRRNLFFSVMGYPWKPPYARMPGGLVIDTPDSAVVRPGFFPAPIVWSALFADALGARYAGGFAPLFSALAVWAFWHFARRRLDWLPALIATGLVAFNAACYWAGRFPLAEPLAWFFVWAGLVALDAYEEDGFPADACLAGALLGAAGLARIEYLAFLAAALALRYVLRADIATRPLTPGFALCFVSMAGAAAAELVLLPGSYESPLHDTVGGLAYRLLTAWADAWWLVVAAIVLALVAWAWVVRRLGPLRAIATAIVASVVGAYVLSSHSTASRSLEWLAAYLGPLALVMGAAGAALAWRERHALRGDGFFVILVLLVGGLLIYSPHVLPAMPWASRRYVAVVVPALLLWAMLAVVRLRSRSAVASLVAGALLVATVTWPARATWRLPFYEGTYAELRRIVDLLPAEGTLLIDNRLIPFMISTPLWLTFDRNSLPIDVSTVGGRQAAAGVVGSIDDRGPVYILKPSTAPQEDIPFVIARRVRDFEIEVALPEQTPALPPKTLENYVELVSLFELTPWHPPSGLPKPGSGAPTVPKPGAALQPVPGGGGNTPATRPAAQGRAMSGPPLL